MVGAGGVNTISVDFVLFAFGLVLVHTNIIGRVDLYLPSSSFPSSPFHRCFRRRPVPLLTAHPHPLASLPHPGLRSL